jgi:fimbrial chaperone protein
VRSAILGALILAATPQAMRAASLEVVPTTIEMPAAGGTAQLRLVNQGNEAVDIQIESFAWTQNGAESLAASDDIIVSPPFVRLDPRRSQIVRLLLAPPAQSQTERSYRILVTQLPDPAAITQGPRVLLQFSVPLFSGDGHAPDVTWTEFKENTGVRLEAHNSGARRAKFTNLELVSHSGQRRRVSSHALTYVLAGATRAWSVGDIASTEGLSLEGDDDRAGRHISIPLAID